MNPAAVSTWDINAKDPKNLSDFLRTSKEHGLNYHNADPTSWIVGGARQFHRKITAQYRFVCEHPEFTHFMFTDSYDVIVCAGWEEILNKYAKHNSPIVFGSECYPWPKTEQAELYPATPHRCRFLNAGFWFGEAKAAKVFLEDAQKIAALGQQCDQGIAVDFFLSKRYPIVLDTSCSLLFCCNIDSLKYIAMHNGRPTCTDTKETPCLFHGNGGSPVVQIAKWMEA